jgi:nucleoside phosphorylase
MIDEALDERGTRWRSTPCAGAPSHEHCAIVSTAHIVTTVAAKAELAARTGADMVDLESAAFASEAQRLGWNWLIVRGVSDGAEDSLPHEIDQWVDATGRTRPGAVALSLLRQPTLAPSLWQLARTSRAAMNNAARLAQSLLASETRSR